MNRNKVMNFGGHSPYPVETAKLFMVIRAIMAPLALNRVKRFLFIFFPCIISEGFLYESLVCTNFKGPCFKYCKFQSVNLQQKSEESFER